MTPYLGPERRKKPRIPVFTCPQCKGTKNLVVDTRGLSDRDGLKRRRKCDCGHTFTTYELPATAFAPST
jgi:DNA-directed RNA polymerase subunit M/transcription elongation factor TFIIS